MILHISAILLFHSFTLNLSFNLNFPIFLSQNLYFTHFHLQPFSHSSFHNFSFTFIFSHSFFHNLSFTIFIFNLSFSISSKCQTHRLSAGACFFKSSSLNLRVFAGVHSCICGLRIYVFLFWVRRRATRARYIRLSESERKRDSPADRETSRVRNREG